MKQAPTTTNQLLMPPYRGEPLELLARKVLRSPSARRLRTPNGQNRDAIEASTVRAYLSHRSYDDKIGLSMHSHQSKFEKALMGVLICSLPTE